MPRQVEGPQGTELSRQSEYGRGSQQQPLDVASYLVDLQVHTRTNDKLAECRYGLRVRDDVHTKHVTFNFVDRQAHAVDGNRTLAGDITRQVVGHCDLQTLRACVAADRGDRGNAINVT